jgi:D-sedoheptulose 7-phosphate isomerase
MGKIVFTNGCFDVIHPGHVDFLERAAELGDRLLVGINSDSSVRSIKGADRPLIPQADRARVLRALKCVDDVVIFDEATPERLIREIKPDVLVKGGDWSVNQIVGADFVASNGGQVISLPLYGDFSSTALIERTGARASDSNQEESDSSLESFSEHFAVFEDLRSQCLPEMRKCAQAIVSSLRNGGKILLFGNGGSAADAQHIAAELIGRYEKERRSLPAIALTTDTSALTAIANDYSYDSIFARQLEGLATAGDVVIGISTSGNSPNVIAGIMKAREKGCVTIGLTGATGKKLAGVCDLSVLVPSSRTARIQEAHIFIGHYLCSLVDQEFSD